MTLLQWVLMAFLALAAALLTGVGLDQRRRRGRLARLAEQLGLRLSVRDFMNLPARYARCLLMQAGHSAYAQNILFGRLKNCFLRAFDYRFELGHGPQRQASRLTVVAGETQRWRPTTAIWRDRPATAALVCMEGLTAAPDDSRWVGDEASARELLASWPGDLGPVTLLTAGRAVLAACPGSLSPQSLDVLLHSAADWVEGLEGSVKTAKQTTEDTEGKERNTEKNK
jgi:hypothetical protein